ncbi:dihydrofolate reductase [Halomonas sp. PR-M31]|uniref:dihydrofolate reductase n=1 Tax=Halomonas sp. PR-M31 TaxID=1471202 RepID=UPI0006515255|nr:dihydrofolate reductase [Halomonas sp. PR-M31]
MKSSQEKPRIAVVMVAALTRNRVIGIDNQLPWHLPEDLKFFKRTTMGKPLIMGRKTFDSIGRPLPGRLNIVVTRDRSFHPDGVQVCHDLADALSRAEQQAQKDGVNEIAVIGGGEIFTQVMPQTSRLYLTEIDAIVTGDTYFPELDESQWREAERTPATTNDDNDTQHSASCPNYAFVIYERR